ncbi:iron-sulfur cluster-binding protein [Natronospirillum operosum]|uniref:Iron-sulfur cluster-binding protein n=2 Tax=Natronospirillum operosum TaxID=2759953 RepID=A0A4Z0WCI4_9GAMM|nr:iron-sulfur cluster-binding protein [Natronospirillum operosum]
MDGLMQKRATALQDHDTEALRDLGAAIRQRALSQLPDLLEQLEANCTRNGIQVHWAQDGDQACQIITDICQQQGARSVIKGKSMVSEEMELNHHLAEVGITALESDLGEYIVQLAEETPSHIIMPAIHKNTEEISELLHDKTGTQRSQDVDYLTASARAQMRQAFQRADVGLSGANFAIAETGTLCLVENEGNGRMSTTVPPCHIAVTGIEKVVQHLADVPPLLSLLTRSATGQHITTYLNMITGPRKAEEQDGPQAVHLVLVDNGRSDIYQDDQLLDTLRCIRCGACMNHCPVYTRVGGHTYGTTYPGPIGKILMPHLLGLEDTRDLPSASSLCGACGEVCPVRIPIPELLVRLRREAVDGDSSRPSVVRGHGVKRHWTEVGVWRAWAWLNSHPRCYRAALRLVMALRFLSPRRLGGWTRYRKAPRPAARSLHQHLLQRNRSSS